MKIKKIIICFCIIILISITIYYYIYQLILLPAYISYASVCQPSIAEDLSIEYNYVVAGTTSVDDNEDIQVEIFIEDDEVIRHEYCHVMQIQQKRMFNCVIPLLAYLNEVECYTLQYIPISVK